MLMVMSCIHRFLLNALLFRLRKYNSNMPDAPLRIRHFQPEDLRQLREIDQICFPAHISFSRAELLFYINHSKSITRVAEAAGRILGFILALVESSRRAHVVTLDVVPEVRRQKIGTMLMDEIHRELEKIGIASIVLEVEIGNLPAQNLYERLEYQYVRILRGYYHGRADAYQMVRSI
jgi:[ribosomal protein S18]-alanine N-acetyltransferase